MNMLDDINRSTREMNETIRKKNNPTGYALERLQSLIRSFEAGITEDYEVGVSVVGSGSAAPFRLRSINVSNPDILIFDGLDDNDNIVRLLQHHSQMGIMLIAIPKATETAFRIGFT